MKIQEVKFHEQMQLQKKDAQAVLAECKAQVRTGQARSSELQNEVLSLQKKQAAKEHSLALQQEDLDGLKEALKLYKQRIGYMEMQETQAQLDLKTSHEQLAITQKLLDESMAKCLELNKTLEQKVQDFQVSISKI